jgi:microsomal dipeptidase-like Zn-dependent dipeptidase
MTHMGFGALKPDQGGRPIWGVPGTSYDDYVGDFPKRTIAEDIPACITGHGGGPTAELVIDTVEGRFSADRPWWSVAGQVIHGRIHDHGHHGGPDFTDFPSFTSGMHQQMHITQIHRAWEGGLRLMTAIAVHNRGLEYVLSAPKDHKIDPTHDRDVLEAQVCGIVQLAKRNPWMEIAYSPDGPDGARAIIERGHLAVIIGVEVDDLGRLDRLGEDIPNEVDYLWHLGIRQVTPVHAIDNRLGGAAIFQPIYNSTQDLLRRGRLDLGFSDLKDWPARFFQAVEGCLAPDDKPGECVLYRFDNDQKRVVLTRRSLPNLFRLAPYYSDVSAGYSDLTSMKNPGGLTWDGAAYLRELMKKGMIIGLEHMGQKTVDDAYQVVAQDLARTDGDCAKFGTRGVEVKASCYDRAYPFIFTHAHFRALSAQTPNLTTVVDFRPSEYEVSAHTLEMLLRTGGVVGQFTAEDPVYPATTGKNDCGGSSKSTAFSLEYAVEQMQGFGVGLATDFTLIRGTSPRFGDNRCSAYQAAHNPKCGPECERQAHPEQYGAMQDNAIQYRDNSHPDGLVKYGMGPRRFDFNTDGMAHYGLLPDFMQDLQNVGLSPAAFGSLFSSAEAYIETWEKAERLAGVPHNATFKPKDLVCEKVCHGLCPDDPNAGAPAPGRLTRR